MACLPLTNWLNGSVPTLDARMNLIWSFPKRLRDYAIGYNLMMSVKPIHAKERMLLFYLTSQSFFRAARNEDADTKDHTSTPAAISRGTHYTQVVAARSCWPHRNVVCQYQPLGTRNHQAQSLLSPQTLRPLPEE